MMLFSDLILEKLKIFLKAILLPDDLNKYNIMHIPQEIQAVCGHAM